MDYETEISNVIFYISSTSDKISNITLKCELELTMFDQILEIAPQFRYYCCIWACAESRSYVWLSTDHGTPCQKCCQKI